MQYFAPVVAARAIKHSHLAWPAVCPPFYGSDRPQGSVLCLARGIGTFAKHHSLRRVILEFLGCAMHNSHLHSGWSVSGTVKVGHLKRAHIFPSYKLFILQQVAYLAVTRHIVEIHPMDERHCTLTLLVAGYAAGHLFLGLLQWVFDGNWKQVDYAVSICTLIWTPVVVL